MSTDKPLDPNAELREQVSALCDGELAADSRRFLLKRLADDAELRSAWSNYHLIGDSLRREAGPPLALDFADRVQAALDAEAAQASRHGWMRWGGGAAVAAAVALAAIITVPVQQSQVPESAGPLAGNGEVAPSAVSERDLRPDISRAAQTVAVGATPAGYGQMSNGLPVRYVPVLQADGSLLLVPYTPLLQAPAQPGPTAPPLLPARAQ
jgi:anti-sigma factor RsiW